MYSWSCGCCGCHWCGHQSPPQTPPSEASDPTLDGGRRLQIPTGPLTSGQMQMAEMLENPQEGHGRGSNGRSTPPPITSQPGPVHSGPVVTSVSFPAPETSAASSSGCSPCSEPMRKCCTNFWAFCGSMCQRICRCEEEVTTHSERYSIPRASAPVPSAPPAPE